MADLRSSQARNWARREKVILGGNWASLFQFVNSLKAFHYLGKTMIHSDWKVPSPQMFGLFPTEQMFLGTEVFYKYSKNMIASTWLNFFTLECFWLWFCVLLSLEPSLPSHDVIIGTQRKEIWVFSSANVANLKPTNILNLVICLRQEKKEDIECVLFWTQIVSSALCAVRKVYFSAQPNNLKLILNFQKYYPIEHIFVPACSSARKEHFFKF